MGSNMIISQLSIAPIGKNTSVSRYVKLVLKVLKEEDVKFTTNAMATVIETRDLETLFNVVKKAHMAVVNAGGKRVITELKIDDRIDKNATAESKIKAVQ